LALEFLDLLCFCFVFVDEICDFGFDFAIGLFLLGLFDCVDLGVEFGNFLAEFVDLKAQFDVDEVDRVDLLLVVLLELVQLFLCDLAILPSGVTWSWHVHDFDLRGGLLRLQRLLHLLLHPVLLPFICIFPSHQLNDSLLVNLDSLFLLEAFPPRLHKLLSQRLNLP
jgi:hypothetical protein